MRQPRGDTPPKIRPAEEQRRRSRGAAYAIIIGFVFVLALAWSFGWL